MNFSEREVGGRAIHLLDLENLAGTSLLTPAAPSWVEEQYRRVVPVGAADLIIVATSHRNAMSACAAFCGARRLVRSGPDGADLALIEVLEDENLAARFGTVYIGSGDGIFAGPTAALAAAGTRVTAVALPGHCSKLLRLAAHDIIDLTGRIERTAA